MTSKVNKYRNVEATAPTSLVRPGAEKQAPVDWRWAALITATLFLNFYFCEAYGLILGGWPQAVDAAMLVAAALLITALFFLGPAMAAQSAKRKIFGLIEDSFGSIPAFVLRLCFVVFLACWIAAMIAVPTL